MAKLAIYGDSDSGNCHKVVYVAELLNIPFEWVELTALSGDTRKPPFLAINPMGQVPAVVLPDGRTLAQSNAIMLHLAEGSRLIPGDAYDRALMHQWLFWEQYSHETAIAVRRFKKSLLKQRDEEIDPALLTKGNWALKVMNDHLAAHRYFVAEKLSLADIALVAYTRFAGEGGFDLGAFPAVKSWVARIEADLKIKR